MGAAAAVGFFLCSFGVVFGTALCGDLGVFARPHVTKLLNRTKRSRLAEVEMSLRVRSEQRGVRVWVQAMD